MSAELCLALPENEKMLTDVPNISITSLSDTTVRGEAQNLGPFT